MDLDDEVVTIETTPNASMITVSESEMSNETVEIADSSVEYPFTGDINFSSVTLTSDESKTEDDEEKNQDVEVIDITEISAAEDTNAEMFGIIAAQCEASLDNNQQAATDVVLLGLNTSNDETVETNTIIKVDMADDKEEPNETGEAAASSQVVEFPNEENLNDSCLMN